MGTLLLKLHTTATEDDGAFDSYYFRESTKNGTAQIQVNVHLIEGEDGVLLSSKAQCMHYTVHMMWADLFETIYPDSTEKFDWSSSENLAESIAKSAFALLR
jgi:hypothetical protein